MAVKGILLDTNGYVAFKRGVPEAVTPFSNDQHFAHVDGLIVGIRGQDFTFG